MSEELDPAKLGLQDAVEAIAPELVELQASLSMRSVRRRLEQSMGLRKLALDGSKAEVAAFVDQVLKSAAGAFPGKEAPANGRSPSCCLPEELWLKIFRHMDFEDLFHCSEVS